MNSTLSARPRIRGASREVQDAARTLRRKLTPAEKVLWRAIRGNQLAGIRFRKQHPLGRFILDFYAPLHHLVVEVDGGIHERQADCDAERDAVLLAYGLRVVRVSNEEVLTDLHSACRHILDAAF